MKWVLAAVVALGSAAFADMAAADGYIIPNGMGGYNVYSPSGNLKYQVVPNATGAVVVDRHGNHVETLYNFDQQSDQDLTNPYSSNDVDPAYQDQGDDGSEDTQ